MNLANLAASTPYRAALDARGRVVSLTLTIAEGVYVVLASPRAPAATSARAGTLSDQVLASLPALSDRGPLAEVVARVRDLASKGGPPPPQEQ